MREGFSPIYNKDSRVLILGSFPSVLSFAQGFYYGNPRNRFWGLMQEIFGGSVDTIADKKQLMLTNNIALWDIVLSGENLNNGREGSADSNLKCGVVADIPTLINDSKIEKIICNGKKSFELFCKYYPDLQKIVVCLPSTSPANVRFDKNSWIRELEEFKIK